VIASAHVLASSSTLNPDHLIQTVGLIGLLAIIFAECGLLVGFFLPGDSLLFAAGLLISRGSFHQPLWLVCVLVSIAAIAGNLTGYAIGRKAGPAVFRRPDSRFFRHEYVDRAQEFFGRYGTRSLILGRFVPVVRTFITVMAGVARMDVRRFAVVSVVGGVLWATGLTLLGYRLGSVDFIANHLELLAVGVVVLSLIPMALELRRNTGKAPTA